MISGSKDPTLVEVWPFMDATRTSEKVPSIISYKDGRPHKWGFGAEIEDMKLQCVKLLLESSEQYYSAILKDTIAQINSILREINKTAEEVVTDYLSLLWEYSKSYIRKTYPHFETTYSLSVILTVPAIWGQEARKSTLKAAKEAGINDVELRTEPEAAALATLRELHDTQDPLQVNCPNALSDICLLFPGRRCIRCV